MAAMAAWPCCLGLSMSLTVAAAVPCAGGKAAIDSNEGVRTKLANIMSYHVVRPVEGYEAFTTPFMSEGVKLQVGTHSQLV